jgi:uncharacterized membrane protein YkoI
MGMTRRSSVRVGVGCGLAVAATIAFATWLPDAAGADDLGRPAAAETAQIGGVELTGSDDESDDRNDDTEDDTEDDTGDDGGEESVARTSDGTEFELEIDPELDAQFGPRPVNGVQAAEIAMAQFGGRVVAAELDEEGGRPIWEVELVGAAVDEADVDAIDGQIL